MKYSSSREERFEKIEKYCLSRLIVYYCIYIALIYNYYSKNCKYIIIMYRDLIMNDSFKNPGEYRDYRDGL